MNPLDLKALAEALPPGTDLTRIGSQVQIGTSFSCNDDTTPFAEQVTVLKTDGTPEQIENWPTGVASPEQMVAFAYFFATLQQQMGDAYAEAVAAGTLPTWSAGLEIPR